MKPTGRPARNTHPESIEFVPKRELDRAQQENERLRKEVDRLQQEAERLRRELEAALRASKRQAAPHSRGNTKANPKRPGRKSGRGYGRQSCRPIPGRVDEPIAVPLPEHCPHCGGDVESRSCARGFEARSMGPLPLQGLCRLYVVLVLRRAADDSRRELQVCFGHFVRHARDPLIEGNVLIARCFEHLQEDEIFGTGVLTTVTMPSLAQSPHRLR